MIIDGDIIAFFLKLY